MRFLKLQGTLETGLDHVAYNQSSVCWRGGLEGVRETLYLLYLLMSEPVHDKYNFEN